MIVGWLIEDHEDPSLRAMDGQGFWFNQVGQSRITTFAYQVDTNRLKHPDWMNEAVIYQVFIDRFHPGNIDGKFAESTGPQDFHGGNLIGVQASLPYLADLGVNCLWLSPINPAESYHRYDVMDYFSIDPILGTADDFRTLVDAAHHQGMRVLLDYVPAHCSWRHPAFLQAQSSRTADTHSWFTFHEWPGSYRSFLDMIPMMPSFDTNDSGVREYLTESALYWMRDFGVDGLRLDHAIGHSMDFWTQFRAALMAENPDVVTIAEATDTPDSLRRFRGRIHDILDFPLARALRHTFAARDWSLEKFDTFLDAYDLYMEEGPGRVSFLDNHDMERFLHVARENINSLKLAALCQFSLNQTPTIYYGTEIGMSHVHSFSEKGFGGDAEARADMIWDENDWNGGLLDFYRQLIHLRRETPILQQGSRTRLYLGEADATYAYSLNSAVQTDRQVIVAFNLSTREQVIPLAQKQLRILLATNNGGEIHPGKIILPPETGVWLTQG